MAEKRGAPLAQAPNSPTRYQRGIFPEDARVSGVGRAIDLPVQALNPYPLNVETGERELAVPGLFEGIAALGRGTAEAIRNPVSTAQQAVEGIGGFLQEQMRASSIRPGQMVTDEEGMMRQATSDELSAALDPTLGGTFAAPLVTRGALGGLEGLMPEAGVVSIFAPASKLMGIEPSRYDAFLDLRLKGADDNVIFQETGIFPGDDNKLRFEIDDSNARFTGQVRKNVFDRIELGGIPSHFEPEAKLGDILDHEELYKFYPEAKNIPVKDVPLFSFGVLGSFDPESGLMRVRKTTGEKTDLEGALNETEKILLHELQHYVQFKHDMNIGGAKKQFIPEGYDTIKSYVSTEIEQLKNVFREAGENPAAYDNLARNLEFVDQINLREATEGLDPDIDRFTIRDRARVQERIDVARDLLGEKQFNELVDLQQANNLLLDIDRRAQNNYKRLSGEGEARLVEARKDMTAEERAEKRPPTIEEFLKEEGVKGEPLREVAGEFSQQKADELKTLDGILEEARKLAKYAPENNTQKFRYGGIVTVPARGRDGIVDVIRKYRRERIKDGTPSTY